MKKQKKGQAAFEYLIIFIFILAALIPLAIMAVQNTQESRTLTEIENALETMISTADSVYSLGPGSEKTITVFFPPAYVPNESYISDKEITLKFYFRGELREASRASRANLTGELPSFFGRSLIKFTMTEFGYVNITEI